MIALLLVASAFPITGNIKVLTVLSGSMEPEIKTGSIVVIKPVENYKIGDVITFGKTVKTPTTHRIENIEVIEGRVLYTTKGGANNAPDTRTVSEKDIIGKVLFTVPFIGYAVDAVKKPFGFMLIIIIPAVVIVYDELRKIRREIIKARNQKKETRNIEQNSRIQENFEVDRRQEAKPAYNFKKEQKEETKEEIRNNQEEIEKIRKELSEFKIK